MSGLTVTVEIPFRLGTKVRIDGGDIIGTIIGVAYYPIGFEVKVAWWHTGTLHEQWVVAWRCEAVE